MVIDYGFMGEIMHRDLHNKEQVYECQECNSIHYETEIAVNPCTRKLYCDVCQSENIRLLE
jgi:Zn finger protein HypA/HybF involved in hydrogenase expression